MIFFAIVSQFILYICLSLLMGTFLLSCVPNPFRPSFNISYKWLYGSAIMIPFAAFIPNVSLLSILAPQFGLFHSIWTILSKYKVGHAYLAMVGFVILLLVLIVAFEKKASKLAAVASIAIIIAICLAMAYVSHASSMSDMAGVAFDFIHLIAVSIWLGILLIISFFSTDAANWEAFLKWFSPTALVAFTAIALSGVLMVDAIVPSYVTGWASSYGQWLFIKHVLLLPLTFIILSNALLVRLKINKPRFEVRTYVKIETYLLLGILAVTAIFSEHQPPMSVVKSDNLSAMFQLLYPSTVEAGMQAYFQMTGLGVVFFILTAVFIGILVVCYIIEAATAISISMIIAIAICFYMGFNFITFFS